jgi:hypothetical protein
MQAKRGGKKNTKQQIVGPRILIVKGNVGGGITSKVSTAK